MNTQIKLGIGALACVTAFAMTAANANAVSIDYHIIVNTGPLIGDPAAPFSVDFQLIDGSGTGNGNNTAVLSNFSFGGGSAFGAPSLIGGTSGALAATVTLTDTDFFNEFFQGFDPGNTLSFDLLLTLNEEPGSTPDAFSVAVLDKNVANIPTTGLGDSLLLINIAGAPALETSVSINPAGVDVSVPESSNSLLTMGLAVASLAGFKRWSNRSAANP